MAADGDIRFVTYLSPSIPRALFEALADHVQRTLGHEGVSLRVESQASGPQKGGECSSFAEEADVAFMCAPSFVWLRDLRPPPVELLGVLPVRRRKKPGEAGLFLRRRGAQRRSHPSIFRARRRHLGVQRCVLAERLLTACWTSWRSRARTRVSSITSFAQDPT